MKATVVQSSEGAPVYVSVTSTDVHNELWRVQLPASASPPDSMAFSELTNDTRQLAIAWSSDSATIFHADLWPLVKGRPADRFRELAVQDSKAGRHTKRIPSMAFHPTRPWIATSGEDTKLCLRDYSGDQPKLLWEQSDTHGTAVHGIAFNKDGSLLASGGGDYLAKVWRTADMAGKHIEPFKVLRGHTDSVFAVAFSPDGERLASGGYDRLIRVWDLTLEDKDGQPPCSSKHGRGGCRAGSSGGCFR